MKQSIIIVSLAAAFLIFACASQDAKVDKSTAPVYSKNSVTLDAAIADIAAYFASRLPAASPVAIVGFEAEARGTFSLALGKRRAIR